MPPENQGAIGIGFSVGGTILWKAASKGLQLKALIAISSTRLRYETQKPECPVLLLFGGKDPYMPAREWFTTIGTEAEFLEDETHNFYSLPANIKKIAARVDSFIGSHE